MKLIYKNAAVSGTTGTYRDVVNKPHLNEVEVLGDLNTETAKVTWFGTRYQYDSLAKIDPNTIYIIDEEASGITGEYSELLNLPTINHTTLVGEMTAEDIGTYNRHDIDYKIVSLKSINVMTEKPLVPLANSLYYVGPNSEGAYEMWLYDKHLNDIYLGLSVQVFYSGKDGLTVTGSSVGHTRSVVPTSTINNLKTIKVDEHGHAYDIQAISLDDSLSIKNPSANTYVLSHDSTYATTARGLNTVAVNKTGHIKSATNKTFDRGITMSATDANLSTDIGHSNALTASSTSIGLNQQYNNIKYDTYGHLTAVPGKTFKFPFVGISWSLNYNNRWRGTFYASVPYGCGALTIPSILKWNPIVITVTGTATLENQTSTGGRWCADNQTFTVNGYTMKWGTWGTSHIDAWLWQKATDKWIRLVNNGNCWATSGRPTSTHNNTGASVTINSGDVIVVGLPGFIPAGAAF